MAVPEQLRFLGGMTAQRAWGRTISLAAFLAFISAPVVCGQSESVEVGDEPYHRVVFENVVVRILDVQIPIGHASLYHRHRLDNIAVSLGTFETSVQRRGDPKSSGVNRVKPGDLFFAAASGQGFVHQVTNVGQTPVRLIDVEFRQPTGVTPLAANASLAPSADTPRYRTYTIALPPGQLSSPLKLVQGVRVVAAGSGIVALGDDGKTTSVDEKQGWHWRSTGVTRLRNTSTAPALVIELEIR